MQQKTVDDANPMNAILNEDDRIAKLSDTAIRDVWVRQKMWSVYRDRVMRQGKAKGKNPFDTDLYRRIMAALKLEGHEERNVPFYDFLRSTDGIRASVMQEANEHPDSIEHGLFDWFTNDDMTDDERVRAARRDLASTMRGACGMPLTDIIRHNLKKWADTEDV